MRTPHALTWKHLFPNTSQRAGQGFPSRAHSVQFTLLLFSLLKNPQLFYIRTPSAWGPPPGRDLVSSRSCELIPRHITQAVPCWVQHCPQFPLVEPERPALVTGWHVSISYPEMISYWGVLSKEWRHRPAEQRASSYDNFPLQPGWRPLIHFPQAKQLLRGNAALCRIVTSAQATANSTVLNHPDSTAVPNSKFPQNDGFTECNCVTALLSLAQDFQGRAVVSPSSCTSSLVSIYNSCRIPRLQILSAWPGAPDVLCSQPAKNPCNSSGCNSSPTHLPLSNKHYFIKLNCK